MKPLKEALRIWQHPDHMIAVWNDMAEKTEREQLLVEWIGNAAAVADLGCGDARLATRLSMPTVYHGFDNSQAMCDRSVTGVKVLKHDFLLCGVANGEFPVVVVNDVAQHYPDPLEVITKVIELWPADRYIFSLLVGNHAEDLYASTVVSYITLCHFLQEQGHTLLRAVFGPCNGENFSWMVMELRK